MESKEPKVRATFSSHTDDVLTVCFSPDQTKLCSAGEDKKVILTNTQSYQTEKVFAGHQGIVYGSDFSCNGEFLVTGSSDDTVRIWNIESESGNSTKLEGHTETVDCVRFFRNDPNRVISGSGDETIKIWSVERKKEISELLGVVDYVHSVDILPDNRTIASGEFGQVGIWDLRSGKIVQILDEHHTNDVYSVQFHPNSFSLACGGADDPIKIYDFRTFQLLQVYQQHTCAVTSVCFHHSGKYLISGSYDHTIKVFDISEKKLLFILLRDGLSDHINSVQFSPDGKYFASGSSDKKVLLWNFPLNVIMICDEKDIDEEERVKYLIQKDLVISSCEEEEEEDKTVFRVEKNILKIKIIDDTLFCYKLFFFRVC